MKNLTIIAAISENNVIGVNNQLPWKISEEMRHFKELTKGNSIIMGRKTFDSIGRPLPSRENIVLTRQIDYSAVGVLFAHTIEEALTIATKEKIFCIGGEEIYRKALPLATNLELTRVYKSYEGDAFFPEVDYSQWQLNNQVDKEGFSFMSYSRK
ncbi:MAG: dihydrofolate reductase [archaeon]